MGETGVVVLITQRSQVQILPPLLITQVRRPLPVPEGAFLLRLVHGFVNERAGTARLGADVIVLTMSLVPGLRRPLLWPSSNRGW